MNSYHNEKKIGVFRLPSMYNNHTVQLMNVEKCAAVHGVNIEQAGKETVNQFFKNFG